MLDNDADQTVDAPTLSSISRSGKLCFVLVTYFSQHKLQFGFVYGLQTQNNDKHLGQLKPHNLTV
jgi:hypothetical protein